MVRSFDTFPYVPMMKRWAIADEMTVYETCMWIWTLGHSRGWQDAELYAKIFANNEISGSTLPELSLSILEEHLGIQNPNHRRAIRGEIDKLFPKTIKNHWRVPAGMDYGDERHQSVISMDESRATNHSMDTGSASLDTTVDSVFGSVCSLEDGKITSSAFRRRCLILTLRPDQKFPVGAEADNLKTIFAKFNYNVEVKRGVKPNSYILIFDDEMMALKANAQSDDLGYKLVKCREKRPSSSNPVMFKTLYPLKVRGGKSFKHRVITTLKKDAIVKVNQRKGCRARITHFRDEESCEWVPLKGWVSLHSETGIKLLIRLEDQIITVNKTSEE